MLQKTYTLTLLVLLAFGTFVVDTSFAQSNYPTDKLLGVNHSSAPETVNLQRISAWPYGPAKAVAVDEQRDLIFLGSGGVVLVLDGQDRTNPQLISESIHTAGLVLDLYPYCRAGIGSVLRFNHSASLYCCRRGWYGNLGCTKSGRAGATD
jgi:hypothetical protein